MKANKNAVSTEFEYYFHKRHNDDTICFVKIGTFNNVITVICIDVL